MATSIGSTTITYNDATTQTTADLGYMPWTTPSRSVGTTYTNSTGKPITWWGTIGNNVSTSNMEVRVDGVTIARLYDYASTSQQNYAGFFAVVPNGSTYGLVVTAGSPVLYYWAEV